MTVGVMTCSFLEKGLNNSYIYMCETRNDDDEQKQTLNTALSLRGSSLTRRWPFKRSIGDQHTN